MRSHGPSTRPHSLVDLYVPSSLGSLEELQAKAGTVGLDAIVCVAHDAFELPDADSVDAANRREGQPRVMVAPLVAGPGYRFILFLPSSDINLESIEAAGDPRVVARAVSELGGLALPVCPRQGPNGGVARQTPIVGEGQHGVVAICAPRSRLGRDLDLEDTAVAERPILGGSGPFATLAEIGRYATLLPIDLRNAEPSGMMRQVMLSLAKGAGFAVELQSKRKAGRKRPEPDPLEGRDDEGEPRQRKRRRRRRKAKPAAS
jgi:hypothetical protein